MEFQPVRGAIAVISVENVQITQGGNPPTKVKLTCGSQFTWNYSAKQGAINCAAIMTIGARIKISYDVVESTNHPGTMMKFINEAVPAQPGEAYMYASPGCAGTASLMNFIMVPGWFVDSTTS